ncbi:MAG: queuosine precursor transporter [Syntrophomonadaceae bacterium]|nr:queuosine precursor transporter [Syntrophomonadaceae bacterium]
MPNVSPLFFWLASFFVTCLLISNIIAGKLIQVKGLVLPAAVILFPVAYILGDVLTEVYGFKRSRLVIWVGFAASAFMSLIFLLTVALPHPEFWGNQEAYTVVLGFTPRLVLASLIAYLIGEFSNAALLSKIKIITGGRWLWTRTIGSTLVGQGIDTLLFISIAFWGMLSPSMLVGMMVAQYLWKVGYEIAATPLTYLLVKWVKNQEGLDTFDYHLRYNPFSLEVEDESV